MNKNRQDLGRRLARGAGVPLKGDFYSVITSAHAGELSEIAHGIGYKRPKNANGSTARYFFAYLQKGK